MTAKTIDTPGRMDAAIIVKMTDEMRDQFREACDKKGITMSEAIRRHIARVIK
jgi:antitoxin component of RelBE/YafQ-DinJ toxin-antitoxin module